MSWCWPQSVPNPRHNWLCSNIIISSVCIITRDLSWENVYSLLSLLKTALKHLVNNYMLHPRLASLVSSHSDSMVPLSFFHSGYQGSSVLSLNCHLWSREETISSLSVVCYSFWGHLMLKGIFVKFSFSWIVSKLSSVWEQVKGQTGRQTGVARGQ